jgi:hypothetical protein
MRFIGWGLLWLLSLGTLQIEVHYSDGVMIKFNSWLK